MYFYFDVVYGKNFEKTDSGVICSAAADFGIKKAFSILKQKYGPNCKISLDFIDEEDEDDEDTIEFEIEFEDEDEDKDVPNNFMYSTLSRIINKYWKYGNWIDGNYMVPKLWFMKWEMNYEFKI